jgi:hypothetical protein
MHNESGIDIVFYNIIRTCNEITTDLLAAIINWGMPKTHCSLIILKIKGYPHAEKPPAPYPLCPAMYSLAFSPRHIVRQPSSQPAGKERRGE